ncbi:efflux RND transporter periplasmic adaptor subunit [Pelotomaculum propionicicum]|uniref:efflux RND transporter periplasmic adaptor subunit n=1 Tax=Pelotomaculum propionicicum TaxID=258475 RepID=UPI003B801755
MKKSIMIAVGLLVMVTFALAGCGAKTGGKKTGGGVVDKTTAQVGRLSGGTVVSGKLEALNSANVVPKTAGRVATVMVDVGSEVAGGDLLLSLDAADLEALVELNAAQLEKARNSDLPAQKNSAEFNLANSEALFKTCEADYERYKQLFSSGSVSSQQFEQVEKQYLQARASYESAQKALEILVNATIPETIRQYEAQLKKARADFANTAVRAPFSGVITAKNINPGEMVSPTVPVISIVNLDTVMVQANVGEDQVNAIQVGQKLMVRVSSVREEPFPGTVTNVAQAASPATKAYPVKIVIENPQHILKPGMFAEVALNTSEEEGIIIPEEALAQDENGSFVWVVDNGRAARRGVEAGHSDGRYVIIKSGLSEGETIAATGIDTLQDGMEVTVQD